MVGVRYKIRDQFKAFFIESIADEELTLQEWSNFNVNKTALELASKNINNVVGVIYDNKEFGSAELCIHVRLGELPEHMINKLNRSRDLVDELLKNADDISDMILERVAYIELNNH